MLIIYYSICLFSILLYYILLRKIFRGLSHGQSTDFSYGRSFLNDLLAIFDNKLELLLAATSAFQKYSVTFGGVLVDRVLCSAMRAYYPHSLCRYTYQLNHLQKQLLLLQPFLQRSGFLAGRKSV